MSEKNKNNIFYKKTGRVFNQHSYWTKQPIEAIDHFILKHSREGEIVLDPFCGSGMTALSASLVNRNAILIDNSPASIHISSGYVLNPTFKSYDLNSFLVSISRELTPFDYVKTDSSNDRKKHFFDIIGEVYFDEKREVSISNKLFHSVKNGHPYPNKINKKYKFKEFKPLYRVVQNPTTKKKEYIKFSKELINQDIDFIKSFQKKIKITAPDAEFFGKEPRRNYKKNIYKVSDMYSKRNLVCLLFIKQKIEEVTNKNLKDFLYFVFSSILFNTSLMSRYRKYENTSIRMGTYYIPPLIKDNNVLGAFQNKAKLIYKSKKDIFDKKLHSNTIKVVNGDASRLKNISTDSVDFIYTDPPYGDVINYSELNIVYESWLGINKKYKNEMIINESEGMDEKYYFNLFQKFLASASRVLKKDRTMILIFHHPDTNLWRNIQECILNSKFRIKETKNPTRLVSKSKTASQRQTNKFTQSFIALELTNYKKTTVINLPNLSEKIINKILDDAEKSGFSSKSEKYDYFINAVLTTYRLTPGEMVKESLNKYLQH